MSAATGSTSPWSGRRRIVVIALGVLAAVALGVAAALHYATRSIEERVLEALGPQSEVSEVRVGLHEVELIGIRVNAPKGWPAADALRAQRVVVTPKLRQLFSERMELTEVRIENAYLSAVRPKSGGGLRMMPGVKERAATKRGESRGGAAIRSVVFDNSTIELFDASVPLKAVRVRIDSVNGTIRDVQIPDFEARTRIDLDGVLKGPRHNGTMSVHGWVDAEKKSAELEVKARNVDLSVFEPYIVRRADAAVETGTFNLDIHSTVRNNVLRAPGTLTLSGLKLAPSDSATGAIASIPRRAAVGALADDEDRITVPFNLEGDLDDPTFSIAGKTALQAGVALIKAFGMSFEGLVRGFFLIVNGLGAGVGSAARGGAGA